MFQRCHFRKWRRHSVCVRPIFRKDVGKSGQKESGQCLASWICLAWSMSGKLGIKARKLLIIEKGGKSGKVSSERPSLGVQHF